MLQTQAMRWLTLRKRETKKPGQRNIRNIYRGISLLNSVYKILTRRIQVIADAFFIRSAKWFHERTFKY